MFGALRKLVDLSVQQSRILRVVLIGLAIWVFLTALLVTFTDPASALQDIVDLVKALIWPAVALIVFWYLQGPLKSWLSSTTVINIDAFGAKIKLTAEENQKLLQKFFDEALESLMGLEEDDGKLFVAIKQSDGWKSVDQLTQEVFRCPFVKDSKEHDRFRNLRQRKLIKPLQKGVWDGSKHPRLTRYAEILLKVDANAIAFAIERTAALKGQT